MVTLPWEERVRVVRCDPSPAVHQATERGGEPPPVAVCVHGWGCSLYSFNRNLRAIADAGVVAIAPDVRGHGWSDKPLDQASYTPEALARWLIGVLDALEIPRALLVGHSMGGAIVLRAGLLAPDRVTGLVLLAPVGFGDIPRTRLLRRLTPAALEPLMVACATRGVFGVGLRMGWGVLGAPTEEDIDEYWAATADPRFVRATRLVAHAFEWDPTSPAELERLMVPVHLILGERDHLVPGALARRVVERLPAARVDVIPGAGHVVAEEAPAIVNAAIAEAARRWR
jgi:pimeloyl-ACP methyl ester carboxylesterase